MSTPTTPYPVNLDLAGRPVLVVGAGPVAARKTASLLRAGARVTVVAPHAVAAIADRADLHWEQRPYRDGEAGGYRLAVTATDDPAVNAQVACDAEAANVFANSADDPPNCTFTLPAVARRGDVQVAVSTNGRSPALARWLRRRLEDEIDAAYETLTDLLAQTRAEARAVFGTSEMPGWDAALDDGLLDLVRAGDIEQARASLHRHLGLTSASTPTPTQGSSPSAAPAWSSPSAAGVPLPTASPAASAAGTPTPEPSVAGTLLPAASAAHAASAAGTPEPCLLSAARAPLRRTPPAAAASSSASVS